MGWAGLWQRTQRTDEVEGDDTSTRATRKRVDQGSRLERGARERVTRSHSRIYQSTFKTFQRGEVIEVGAGGALGMKSRQVMVRLPNLAAQGVKVNLEGIETKTGAWARPSTVMTNSTGPSIHSQP